MTRCQHAALRGLYRGLCPLCVVVSSRGTARIAIDAWKATAFYSGGWRWLVSRGGTVVAKGAPSCITRDAALREAVHWIERTRGAR